jgi:hypothetical protein
MLHSLNAKLNRLLIQSNLSLTETVKVIGAGSDGIVFTSDEIKQSDGKPITIKNFSASNNKPHLRDARKSISHDQAIREFCALDIIMENPPIPGVSHPSFPKLLARELDNITSVKIGNETRRGYAVRMEVIEHAKCINETSPIWGMKWHSAERIQMDFDHRNDNLCDIACQLRLALRYLQGIGLRHRHLEAGNIHVRLPDLTVIIMDFARADIPPRINIKGSSRGGISVTSPQRVMERAKDGCGRGFEQIDSELQDEPDSQSLLQEKDDIETLYINSYSSALSDTLTLAEVSDYSATRAVIFGLWSEHRNHDLKQYQGDENVGDENDAMETMLLETIFPGKGEPETLPISITRAIYRSREKRLAVINDIITKRGFADCCKRVKYTFFTHSIGMN